MSLRDQIISRPGESDAQISAALSTPTYQPRADRITFTSLGAIWGAVAAATFHAALKSAAATDATAAYVFDLLAGGGFDPANADVANVAAQLVGAGLLSADQARDGIDVAIYPLGQPITEQQVSDERAAMARDALYAWASQQFSSRYAAVVAAIDAGQTDPAQLTALFAQG